MTELKPSDATAEVDICVPALKTRIAGPAWVVITIIALLGMIWVASRSLDVATKAIGRTDGPRPELTIPVQP